MIFRFWLIFELHMKISLQRNQGWVLKSMYLYISLGSLEESKGSKVGIK